MASKTSKDKGPDIRTAILFFCGCLFSAPMLSAATIGALNHESWNTLLQTCVIDTPDGHSTSVNYDCFAERRERLDNYLNDLAGLGEAALLAQPDADQLAFLINAYNAWTVALILDNWPDVESIRDLGSILRSPWKKTFIPLVGETVSLDDIEHGMIRDPGRFDDPRIHFAVNCASIGCPALRKEAYRGDIIEAQLEEQTRSFLADPSRNRSRGKALEISSIFKWYRADFEQGWRGSDSLTDFLHRYSESLGLSAVQAEDLLGGDIELVYLDYDWRLNIPRQEQTRVR